VRETKRAINSETHGQVPNDDLVRTVPGTRADVEPLCIACEGRLGAPRRIGAALLAACQQCGSRTAVPRPTPNELKALHDSRAYFEKEYFDARRNAYTSTNRRLGLVTDLIRKVRGDDFLRGRRMLDVGCDTGDFLLAAKAAAGIEPYGVEVSTRAAEIATGSGVTVSRSDLADAPAHFENFALVTVIDVIEHIAQPMQLLESIAERLAANGLVYIETPNWGSAVYLVGERLARISASRPRRVFERLFPPEHVQYFTLDGIYALIHRTRLRALHVATRPLPFRAVAGAKVVKAGTWAAQLPDRGSDRRIVICALLSQGRRGA
jgi:2-polyprenyl-3-methyl-5-hydroxy-6-metoxy-1,4-benzoquinol methylase